MSFGGDGPGGRPHRRLGLGHSSIATTGDTDGHVSPDVVRQAMSTLGEAFDR